MKTIPRPVGHGSVISVSGARCGFFLFLALFFLASVSLAGDTPRTDDSPRTKGAVAGSSVRTVIVANYAPYSFLNAKGVPDGFSVDVARAVAAAMDLHIEIRADKWDRAMKELEAGGIDLLPMMAYSRERDLIFDFSVPHTIAYDAIFVKEGNESLKSLADLAGKTVIVMNRDAAHGYLLSSGLSKTMKLRLVESLPEALRLLSAGEGDAAIMPKLVGIVTAKNLKFAHIVTSPRIIGEYNRPFSFAVKEGNQALLERLNQGMNIIKSTGEYNAIYNKWFGALEDPYLNLKTRIKYVAAGVAVLVCFLAWNIVLKLQVKTKTRHLESEIEKRKSNEQALFASEEKLEKLANEQRIILNTSSVGISFVRERRIVWANPVHDLLFGYEPGATHHLYTSELFADDAAYAAFGEKAYPTLNTGAIHSEDQLMKKRDGTLFWCNLVGQAVNPDNGYDGCIWVVVDINERKRGEAALIESKKIADRANQLKSEFLANTSHEIRTPMNAIIGLSYLALKTGLNNQQRDYIVKIHRNAESLLGILNDLLDFSKIEADRVTLEMLEFDLSEVLEKVGNQTFLREKESGVDIVFSVSPDVPCLLIGDAYRLGQILNNLVSNAIKFTERGRILVTVVKATAAEQGTIALTFTVSDTGIGIEKENIADIFSPFTQADGSITRRYGGTGLGLSIVKRLVELMGGSLRVESEPGVGSSFAFTISLALAASDRDRASRTSTPGHPRATLKSDMRQLEGARILVVEDNDINREIMCEILSEVGLRVTLAGNGEEAVKIVANSSPFDAVLMDLQMPTMDGYEATARIRRLKSAEVLPIIAITAHAMFDQRERCFACGMNDHLAKPIDREELYDTLLRLVPPKKRTPARSGTLPNPGEPERRGPRALPGIAVDRVMARFNGNWRLFHNVLIAFKRQNSSVVAEIRQAHAGHDRERLGLLVHSLKGVAANIGAETLAVAAGRLENAVRHDQASNLVELIDALEGTLAEVLEAARLLESSEAAAVAERPAVEPTLPDRAALARDLGELRALLSLNKIAALDKFGALKAHLPDTEACRELEVQISRFDFRKARTTLGRVADGAGIVFEEETT